VKLPQHEIHEWRHAASVLIRDFKKSGKTSTMWAEAQLNR
jgi:hypothetical protein